MDPCPEIVYSALVDTDFPGRLYPLRVDEATPKVYVYAARATTDLDAPYRKGLNCQFQLSLCQVFRPD